MFTPIKITELALNLTIYGLHKKLDEKVNVKKYS